jgi:hypothetical protein
MRYYIAAISDPGSAEMDYKESGNEADLYLRFPEIIEVIKRYNIKSLGLTFVNGDRLRIYGVNKATTGLTNELKPYRGEG